MTRDSKALTRSRRGLAAVLALLLAPAAAMAADNTATGDINGVSAALNPSNTFTINPSTLSLVKAAFLSDGTQLASGVTVPAGTTVRFLIYVDNPTGVPVSDLSMEDVLVAGFQYTAGTLRTDASQASGATDAAIYAAAAAASPVTDAVDGDAASITGATVSAGSTAGNSQIDLLAGTVRALLFDVTIQ
jgi:uncharacterized repeat protein (TIGR01451 family)